MSKYTDKCLSGGFYEPGVPARYVPRPLRRRLRSLPRSAPPAAPPEMEERLDAPLIPRRTPLPREIGRFPTDAELDAMWSAAREKSAKEPSA